MSSTTTGLSNLMSIYYDKVFLDRAELALTYDVGAQTKNLPSNSGKTVYFNRFSPLAVATTALTEAAVPTAVDMTSTQVTATLAVYGSYAKVGTLFNMTSIDEGLKEHVAVMGQNAGETLDTLLAATLSGSNTAQLAGAKSNITAVAATDVLSGAEIRKAIRTLKKNKAKTFSNGMFKGIIAASAAYDLRGNSEWLDASRYVDATNIRNGQLGKLYGVEFYETNNEVTTSSTVTVYHNFILGQNSYGTVNLANQPGSRIFVKTPGPSDTSNPVDSWSTVGWKANFAATVLNSDWIVDIKCGVTA
jgi:N4-gp56 family major capsid protein